MHQIKSSANQVKYLNNTHRSHLSTIFVLWLSFSYNTARVKMKYRECTSWWGTNHLYCVHDISMRKYVNHYCTKLSCIKITEKVETRTGMNTLQLTVRESRDSTTRKRILADKGLYRRSSLSCVCFSSRHQQSRQSSWAAFCVWEDAHRFQRSQLGDKVLQHSLQLHVQLPTWS